MTALLQLWVLATTTLLLLVPVQAHGEWGEYGDERGAPREQPGDVSHRHGPGHQIADRANQVLIWL